MGILQLLALQRLKDKVFESELKQIKNGDSREVLPSME